MLKHKFQSVGKRYTPSWSVLPTLGLKLPAASCRESSTLRNSVYFIFAR